MKAFMAGISLGDGSSDHRVKARTIISSLTGCEYSLITRSYEGPTKECETPSNICTNKRTVVVIVNSTPPRERGPASMSIPNTKSVPNETV